jgi:hypothetical protein
LILSFSVVNKTIKQSATCGWLIVLRGNKQKNNSLFFYEAPHRQTIHAEVIKLKTLDAHQWQKPLLTTLKRIEISDFEIKMVALHRLICIELDLLG